MMHASLCSCRPPYKDEAALYLKSRGLPKDLETLARLDSLWQELTALIAWIGQQGASCMVPLQDTEASFIIEDRLRHPCNERVLCKMQAA